VGIYLWVSHDGNRLFGGGCGDRVCDVGGRITWAAVREWGLSAGEESKRMSSWSWRVTVDISVFVTL